MVMENVKFVPLNTVAASKPSKFDDVVQQIIETVENESEPVGAMLTFDLDNVAMDEPLFRRTLNKFGYRSRVRNVDVDNENGVVHHLYSITPKNQ